MLPTSNSKTFILFRLQKENNMPSVSFASVPEEATLYIDGKEKPVFALLFCYGAPTMKNDAIEKLNNYILGKGHATCSLFDEKATSKNLNEVSHPYSYLFIFGHGLEDSIGMADGLIVQSQLELANKVLVATTCNAGRSFCKKAVVSGGAKGAIGYNVMLSSNSQYGLFTDGFSECFQEAQRSIERSVTTGEEDAKKIVVDAYNDAISKYNEHIDKSTSALLKLTLQRNRDNLVYYTEEGVQTTINIATIPSGAEVWLDDYGYVGKSPIADLNVRSEGNYISTLRYPGKMRGGKTLIVPSEGANYNIALREGFMPITWVDNEEGDVWFERKNSEIGGSRIANARFVVVGSDEYGFKSSPPRYIWDFFNRGNIAHSIKVSCKDTEDIYPNPFSIPAHSTVRVAVEPRMCEECVGDYTKFTFLLDANKEGELTLLMTADIYFKMFEILGSNVEIEWNRILDASYYTIIANGFSVDTTEIHYSLPEMWCYDVVLLTAKDTEDNKVTEAYRKCPQKE